MQGTCKYGRNVETQAQSVDHNSLKIALSPTVYK